MSHGVLLYKQLPYKFLLPSYTINHYHLNVDALVIWPDIFCHLTYQSPIDWIANKIIESQTTHLKVLAELIVTFSLLELVSLPERKNFMIRAF
jgi:hypothetical protein